MTEKQYPQWRARARETRLTRERLAKALVWGACHTNTKLERAEAEYRAWIEYGEAPSYMRHMKMGAIVTARKYVNGIKLKDLRAMPPEDQLESIKSNIHGLGYVKGAFALTSIGLSDIACLDRHIARMRLGLDHAPQTKDAIQYLDCVERAYGCVEGSGARQWDDFWEISDAFRRSQHRVWFESIGVA